MPSYIGIHFATHNSYTFYLKVADKRFCLFNMKW